MSWTALAGSLAAVLALAAIAWAMGLGGAPALDAESARAEAETLPGFAAGEVFLSSDGRAALVTGKDGSAALVKAHGTQLVSRRLARVDLRPADGGVIAASGERMFGDVTLRLADAERDRLLSLV